MSFGSYSRGGEITISRAEEQKQHETAGVGVPGGPFGESHEAVSKIKLNISKAVLAPALVKLQAGSREHLCPPSCAEAGAALGSQGTSPSPVISAGWGAAAAG